uniref:G domain-containing protein n=1 Tax=Romanomermis culicivorax TaxID=13658 RepID=A0A915J8W4_ROMCU
MNSYIFAESLPCALRRLRFCKILTFEEASFRNVRNCHNQSEKFDSDEQSSSFDSCQDDNSKRNNIKITDFSRLNPDPKAHKRQLNRSPENFDSSRLLNVAIIGKTNAGKSLLTNALVGAAVSGVSKRCHTTRKLTQGVTVCGKSQLIFNDTPGFLTGNIKNSDVENSLVTDPENALQQARMILVLHDPSDNYNRNRLEYRVQYLLYKYRHLPSILVLNKIDLLKNQTFILELITKLTLGRVNGHILRRSFNEVLTESDNQKPIENEVKFNQIMETYKSKRQVLVDDDEIIQKEIEKEKLEDDYKNAHNSEILMKDFETKMENFDRNLWPDVDYEILDELCSESTHMHKIPISRLKKCFIGQTGWPNFQAVFSVSALNGSGVDRLKNFLLERAENRRWRFHSSIVSPLSTLALVKENVRAKVMEKVPFDLPYKLDYKIISWEVNEFDTLCILMEIICEHERFVPMITGPADVKLKAVSKESSQDLSNLFGRDVYVRFTVRPKRFRGQQFLRGVSKK